MLMQNAKQKYSNAKCKTKQKILMQNAKQKYANAKCKTKIL